ncbi:MAG: hypothetical protein OEM05_17830 [Myxococcales bacterium]|nr:hypothetical protein [Myxococcales bacterium]
MSDELRQMDVAFLYEAPSSTIEGLSSSYLPARCLKSAAAHAPAGATC